MRCVSDTRESFCKKQKKKKKREVEKKTRVRITYVRACERREKKSFLILKFSFVKFARAAAGRASASDFSRIIYEVIRYVWGGFRSYSRIFEKESLF